MNPTRKLSSIVYGSTFVASFILTGLTAAPKIDPSTSASQSTAIEPQSTPSVAASSPTSVPVPMPPEIVPSSPSPVSPQITGIGVSRSAIQSVFEKPEIGFRFEPSSDVDGQPRIMGTAPSGLANVELIGQPEELVSATVMIGLPNDSAEARMENAVYALGFIKVAAPQWTNGDKWLTEQITAVGNGGAANVSTTFGNNRAELVVIRDMGLLTLTIKPNE